MKTDVKTHPMEIPKEIIAWFFTESEKQGLEVYLVQVVGLNDLLVDVVYRPKQRMKVMLLIEGVDEFLHEKEQRKLDEEAA